MITLAETVDAVIGIDTHRDSHEVEIADPAGTPVMTMQIGNDSAGAADFRNSPLSITGIPQGAERCGGLG